MAQPLDQQVVVITGASSGIGRAAAMEFARQGASVVLAARGSTALKQAAQDAASAGGRVLLVPTDVAEWQQVQNLADAAVGRFGRIDTWVNNASVAEYALIDQMTIEEINRIIQVNLNGVIYGTKAALERMRPADQGTIINVASVLGRRSVGYLSVYSAAKHGVKGFSEALRLELAHTDSNIQLTVVYPSSINTPFFRHARSKLGVNPRPIPPVYEPEAVAQAIVFAAQHRRREIVVGGGGKLLELVERLSPALADRLLLMNGLGFKMQRSDEPDNRRDNLFEPWADPGSITGNYGHEARSLSLYTRYLALYPNRVRAFGAGVMLGMAALLTRIGR